jgi:hypothetical protein
MPLSEMLLDVDVEVGLDIVDEEVMLKVSSNLSFSLFSVYVFKTQ